VGPLVSATANRSSGQPPGGDRHGPAGGVATNRALREPWLESLFGLARMEGSGGLRCRFRALSLRPRATREPPAADRRQGNQGQLDVLDSGDADIVTKPRPGRKVTWPIASTSPPAENQITLPTKPQGAGAQVSAAGEFASADRLVANGPERKIADHENRPAAQGNPTTVDRGPPDAKPPAQAITKPPSTTRWRLSKETKAWL